MKIPGLILTFLIAILAYLIDELPFAPFTVMTEQGEKIHPLEPMVLAIILGLIIGNFILNSQRIQHTLSRGWLSQYQLSFTSGISFAVKRLLPLGVVLMGVKFDLMRIIDVSANALILNIVCVMLAYYLSIWLCKWLSVDSKMTSLIAAGTAICGGTAVVVASPIVKADKTQTSIAVTIVSLFGLIAIFLYPIIGHILQMDQKSFGIWAGTAIQAIPQVVAAGFAFGAIAGEVGTIVKMVRILLLAPMIFLIGMKHKNQQAKTQQINAEKQPWYTYFPRFIIFFLFVVILKTVGVFEWLNSLITILPLQTMLLLLSSFLMVMAMAGVGLSADLAHMLRSGIKPLLAGFIAATVMAFISLVLVLLFF